MGRGYTAYILLREHHWNLEQIAELFCVSRERVRQAVKAEDGAFRSRGDNVTCAICRRFARAGEFTIAPAASVYAGKPICARCIDMAPVTARRLGPTETKEVAGTA